MSQSHGLCLILGDASSEQHEYGGDEDCEGCPLPVFQSKPNGLHISPEKEQEKPKHAEGNQVEKQERAGSDLSTQSQQDGCDYQVSD